MRRTTAQGSGFTIVETMIALALTGLLMALLAKLVGGGLDAWLNGSMQMILQQQARGSRDTIAANLKLASASSVLIGRTNTAQPERSMLFFVDVQGQTLQYWQEGTSLWAKVQRPGRPDRTERLMADSLDSFRVYYPSQKTLTSLGVGIALEKRLRYLRRPVRTQVSVTVDMRNP